MDSEEPPKRCPECGEVLAAEWCSKCGWHAGEISVQLWEIDDICSQIEKRTANPNDARRLYQAFCELVEHDQPVPLRLLKRLASAFRAYFYFDQKNLELSLGLGVAVRLWP